MRQRHEHPPDRGTIGPLTVDEYLAWEENSPIRHEYVRGRVYAMSGTKARHNAIVNNMLRHVWPVRGACAVYTIDLKVRPAEDRIYYPDCVVVCSPHDLDTLIFSDPCLIVEVTSRSTRRIDRGEKLDAYLAMPSLRGYLIVEGDRRHATLYTREETGWARDEIVGSGDVKLPCIGATLALDNIYEGADPPKRVREGDEDGDADDDWLGEDDEPVDDDVLDGWTSSVDV